MIWVKKRVMIGLCTLAALLILLFPFSVTKLDDSGAVRLYEAVLYSVEDTHEWRVNTDDGPAIQEGTTVEILGFTVYHSYSLQKI